MNICLGRFYWIAFGLYLFAMHPTIGQGYNKTYSLGASIGFISVGAQEDQIFIAGYYKRSLSEFQSVFVACFDTIGNINWFTEITDDSSSITLSPESGIVITDDNRIGLPLSYLNRPSLGLAIIKSDGIIEKIQEFSQDSGSVIASRDIFWKSGSFLITGWISKPPFYKLNAFVLKTNEEGIQEWMNEYGNPSDEETVRSISELNSNEYLISGTRYSLESEPNFQHGWIAAIDSLGHLKWEWEATSEELFKESVLSMQIDRAKNEVIYFSYLIRPTTYPDEDYSVSVPILVRRDLAMNLISYTELGPYAFDHYLYELKPCIDGGWIACGSITRTTDEYLSPLPSRSGKIIKLFEDDSLAWSIVDTAFFHPELGSRSYLSGITETKSRFIYSVGWTNHYDNDNIFRSSGWLLKISQDGCVDTLCTTTSLFDSLLDNKRIVKVFPNPASEFITIELNQDINQISSFEIFDLEGKLILSRFIQTTNQEIKISDLNKGLYYWRIVNQNDGLINSGKIAIE